VRQLYERFDVDEETPVQYVGVYTTKWRSEWGQPEVMFREAEEQPCGHPAACIVSSDEGTNYCGWCVSLDTAADAERERCAGILEQEAVLQDRYGEPPPSLRSLADAIREGE